jgi:hypothetical protein
LEHEEKRTSKIQARHIIFILVALAVVIPLIWRIGLPLKITSEVKNVFDYINTLPEGSCVIFSFDHDTSTLPEMIPLAEALLRHCYNKNLKIIGMALLAEGAAVGEDNMRRIGNEFHKKYGVDYLFLGFRPQFTVAILGLGESIDRVFPTDYFGDNIHDFPIMNNIKNYNDIAAVISIGDGDIPVYWVNYAQARYKVHVIPAVTAVMATTMYPFLQSGQIVGLVAGLKGAAEYEELIGKPGRAVKGMDAQSSAHLLIILLIITGNIGLIIARMRKRK